MTTNEGGVVDEEYQVLRPRPYRNDGRVSIGLTTSCAVCHDHKFDPISAKSSIRCPHSSITRLKDATATLTTRRPRSSCRCRSRPRWEEVRAAAAELDPQLTKIWSPPSKLVGRPVDVITKPKALMPMNDRLIVPRAAGRRNRQIVASVD